MEMQKIEFNMDLVLITLFEISRILLGYRQSFPFEVIYEYETPAGREFEEILGILGTIVWAHAVAPVAVFLLTLENAFAQPLLFSSEDLVWTRSRA